MEFSTRLIGYIARDCEVKEVGDSLAISFSVAHSEKYTSKGELKDKTTWVNCTLWRKKENAKISEYLLKGQIVSLRGEISTRAYMKDGQPAASLDLRISDIKLIGSRNSEAKQAQPQKPAETPITADVTEDDLPF